MTHLREQRTVISDQGSVISSRSGLSFLLTDYCSLITDDYSPQRDRIVGFLWFSRGRFHGWRNCCRRRCRWRWRWRRHCRWRRTARDGWWWTKRNRRRWRWRRQQRRRDDRQRGRATRRDRRIRELRRRKRDLRFLVLEHFIQFRLVHLLPHHEVNHRRGGPEEAVAEAEHQEEHEHQPEADNARAHHVVRPELLPVLIESRLAYRLDNPDLPDALRRIWRLLPVLVEPHPFALHGIRAVLGQQLFPAE